MNLRAWGKASRLAESVLFSTWRTAVAFIAFSTGRRGHATLRMVGAVQAEVIESGSAATIPVQTGLKVLPRDLKLAR